MEVSGIDPEIVGNHQSAVSNHPAAGSVQQVGQATGSPASNPKTEIDTTQNAQGNVENNAVSAHNASLVANQYAAAAAYGPPVAVQSVQAGNNSSNEAHARVGKRRVRLGWTEDETRNLMEGCKRHGVGNWKKILTDPAFHFNCRTAVDLKDRFRTSFPEEYSRLYPNARTHKVKGKSSGGGDGSLIKVSRKERRAFTADEDERLLQGFLKHGPAWSKIQRDQSLGLGDRRSTDLRDRFRNAYPDRYTAAGYKGRTSATKSSGPVSNSGGELTMGGSIDDELANQQNNVIGSNGGRYLPGAQMMQQMPYAQYAQAPQYNAQGQQRAQQQQQQYNPQSQQQFQYNAPMYYGMGMTNQVPMPMTGGMNQLGQMNPQMNGQMRQMPMNMGQMGVWPNQQQ